MVARIVTANRLTLGDVVYLDGEGGWTPCIAGARVGTGDEEVEAMLSAAEDAVARREVVGPYAVAVEETEAGPVPVHIKERIRARGPTVHPEFGRSADCR